MLCDCAPRDLHSFPTRRSSDLFLPCAVSCTVYFPGKASAPEGRRNEARAPFAGGYRKSHTKRCIPASAESFCGSRPQEVGNGKSFAFTFGGTSSLENRRTSVPSLLKICS